MLQRSLTARWVGRFVFFIPPPRGLIDINLFAMTLMDVLIQRPSSSLPKWMTVFHHAPSILAFRARPMGDSIESDDRLRAATVTVARTSLARTQSCDTRRPMPASPLMG